MKERFVALPVGQGDSFFLNREGFNILVDGGRSIEKLPSLIDKYLKIDHLDIVVCTHNDADHTNGIIGILKNTATKISEIWLPGNWSPRLEDLVNNPKLFISELCEQIPSDNSDVSSLESWIDLHYHEMDYPSSWEEKSYQEEIERNSETESQNEIWWKIISNHRYFFHPRPSHISNLDLLWLDTVDAAKRIREIYLLACDNGIPVRWFDFNKFQLNGCPSGSNKFLKPINSCEIKPDFKSKIKALHYLALTVSNKQSLVFLTPENKIHPGVLFTADSDFSFITNNQSLFDPKPKHPFLITAPHHGSESNAKAYNVINSWHSDPKKIIWIRSDGRFKNRPGKSYLSVQGERLCTNCRPFTAAHQLIEFSSNGKKWNPIKNPKTCDCSQI